MPSSKIFRQGSKGKAGSTLALGPPGQLLADLLEIDETEPAVHQNISAFLGLVLRTLVERCYIEHASVLWYSDIEQRLSLIAEYPPCVPEGFTETFRLGEYVVGEALDTQETILINDVPNDPRIDSERRSTWNEMIPSGGIRSAIYIPFHDNNGCAGVVRIMNRLLPAQHTSERPETGFTKTDQRVLEKLVDVIRRRTQIAWARTGTIRVSQWAAEILRRNDEEPTVIAAQLTAEGREVTNCMRCAVYLAREDDPSHLNLVAQSGFSRAAERRVSRLPIASTITGRVFESKKAKVLPDVLAHEGAANLDVARQEQMISGVIVPVETGSIRGIVSVFSTRKRSFERTQIEHLRYLGGVYTSIHELSEQTLRIDGLRDELGSICHNLRRPFGGIDAFRLAILRKSARLKWRAEKNDFTTADVINDMGEVERYANLMHAEIERGRRRTTGMLLGHPGALESAELSKEPTKLSLLIKDICSAYHKEAHKRNVRLVVRPTIDNLPVIQADREKLEIAIENLVENAIKYSWENEDVVVSGALEGRFVSISFTDQGLGIPEHAFDSIFNRSFRSEARDTRRYIMGTGLGLNAVKQVVEAHGGTVKAESRPFLSDPGRIREYEGFTTTLTVKLPA